MKIIFGILFFILPAFFSFGMGAAPSDKNCIYRQRAVCEHSTCLECMQLHDRGMKSCLGFYKNCIEEGKKACSIKNFSAAAPHCLINENKT